MVASISTKIIGLGSLSRTFKKKSKKINEVDDVMGEGAFRVERDAKIGAPVNKGILRSGIHTSKIKFLKWKVSDSVNYGIWQEIGTRYISGKYFMLKAARKNSKFIANSISKVYK